MSEYEDIFDEGVDALRLIADAIRKLGNADDDTPMGALQLIALEIKDGAVRIEAGLNAIAQAITEHGS